MHSYGRWPDERFGDVENAAWYIGKNLARWGRIHVSQTKEKFGTVRVYCSFGLDSFYGIWRPRHMWVPTWWPWKLDLTVFAWIAPFVNKFVIPYQKMQYRRFYKKAVEKWPHLHDEIVSCADWGEILEGAVPGYKHSDYWKEVK